MLPDEIGKILEDSKAILHGHFLLTSGLHSPTYLEKFRLLQFPSHTERLCSLIADHYRDSGVQVVAGPALGGVILAYEVARQLGVRSIYAERVDGTRAFRRGLSIVRDEMVLVVDDILTTGGSVREVIDAARKDGGHVLGAGVLIDRSDGDLGLMAPLFSCYRLAIPTYSSDRCPECKKGIPLSRLGGGL